MRSLNLLKAYTSLAYPVTQSAGTGVAVITQTTGVVSGITAHLLVLGDTIVFDTLNANSQTNAVPPAPLLPGVEYWVIPVTADTFKLATTYANAVAGTFIVPTGSTVSTATYTVNHYPLFANDEYTNGLSPYLPLVDSQIVSPVYTNGPVTSYAFTATSASPAVYTTAAPAGITWVNGQAVKLGGVLGANFKANTVYYVVAQSTDTFELSATVGGSAINGDGSITGAGYVYLVSAADVGTTEYSGETGDVGLAPGSPFFNTSVAVLVSQLIAIATDSDGTVITIDGASQLAGSPDVPGTWKALYTFPTGTESAALAAAQAATVAINMITLPTYIRVHVAVATSVEIGIAAVGATANLLGN